MGSNHGRDVIAYEAIRDSAGNVTGEREWRHQAKQYNEFGPAEARKVVQDAVGVADGDRRTPVVGS